MEKENKEARKKKLTEELFEALKVPLPEKFPSKLAERYEMLGALVRKHALSTDTIREKAAEIAITWHPQALPSTLRTALESWVERNLDLNGYCHEALDLEGIDPDRPAKNRTTCGVCGEQYPTDEIQSVEVPEHIKVQMFSNRLEPHKIKEPRHRVCPLCKMQYLLSKKMGYTFRGKLNPVAIYVFPDTFFPRELLREMEKAADALISPQEEEEPKTPQSIPEFCRYLPIPSKINQKLYESVEWEFGSFFFYPFLAPFIKSGSEMTAFAAMYASFMTRSLPVRLLISEIPTLTESEMDTPETIHAPDLSSAFSSILVEQELWANVFELYLEKFIDPSFLVYLARKKGTETRLSEIMVEFKKDPKMNKRLLKLFQEFGGEKMTHLKTMATLARLWALGRSNNWKSLTDHQFAKPFDDAVKALRSFNPETESTEDLQAEIVRRVTFSIEPDKKNWKLDEVIAFADEFLQQVQEIGKGNFQAGREIFLKDWVKYRNIFLGNVYILSQQAFEKKQKESEKK